MLGRGLQRIVTRIIRLLHRLKQSQTELKVIDFKTDSPIACRIIVNIEHPVAIAVRITGSNKSVNTGCSDLEHRYIFSRIIGIVARCIIR